MHCQVRGPSIVGKRIGRPRWLAPAPLKAFTCGSCTGWHHDRERGRATCRRPRAQHGGWRQVPAAVAGETLLARVIARAAPQAGPLILNANGDPERFASYGLPVVADVVEGHAGPLAGILTALDWAAENAPHCPLVASFATDAPFLPRDLVETMADARDLAGADLACAASGGPYASGVGSGRWRSAPTCARPWSSRASGRSTAGPQATGWWRWSSPAIPWTRSSMPTRAEDLPEARAPDRGARPELWISRENRESLSPCPAHSGQSHAQA